MTINLPQLPLLPLLLMKDDTIYYRFKCYPVVYDENFDYDIIKKFSIVIVDSRLSDLIIEVSFDKPNLLIFDTSKQNCVLTLFQYVTRKTFYVENNGNNPLEIYRAYSLEEGIEVEISKTKIKKGTKAIITVRLSPSLFKGEILNGTINLVVNDPNNPTPKVRVVGIFE